MLDRPRHPRSSQSGSWYVGDASRRNWDAARNHTPGQFVQHCRHEQRQEPRQAPRHAPGKTAERRSPSGGGETAVESDHLSFPEEAVWDCGLFSILIKGELDFTIKIFTDKDGTRDKGVETGRGTEVFINSVTRKEIGAPFHNTVLIDPR